MRTDEECRLANPPADCLSTPLYRSRDEGRTWTRLSITGHDLAVGGARRTVLYLEGGEGGSRPLASDNGGDSWRTLPGTGLVRAGFLTPDATLEIGAYAAGLTPSGVTLFYSPDRGKSWKSIEAGGLDRFHRGLPAWLVTDPKTPGRLYVGVQNGGGFVVQVER